MNVSHKPIKNIDVAMDANVYVIESFGVTEILFKVFHIRNKQIFIAFEVFVHFFVLITDMNNDLCTRVQTNWCDLRRILDIRQNSLLLGGKPIDKIKISF
jgi:hypothetical protein